VYAAPPPGVRQSRIQPTARTSSSEAMKPAWLVMPLALASRSGGLKVRATSKPIMDAGPPSPTTSASAASSGSGA